MQKSFGDGITYNVDEKLYNIKINQDDTALVAGGAYVYDIKLVVNGDPLTVKTLIKDTLNIAINATHKENE